MNDYGSYDSYGRLIKSPKGAGQLLVYLDFDGVLHHENCLWTAKLGPYLSAPPHYKLFQHVGLLDELLAPYPDIKIVLSTSWVRVYSFSKAVKRLPKALQARVIGATYHASMDPNEFQASARGTQVWNDVVTRKPAGWIALDDDHLNWPKPCLENYVRTHPHEGICDPIVRAEIERKLALLANGSKE